MPRQQASTAVSPTSWAHTGNCTPQVFQNQPIFLSVVTFAFGWLTLRIEVHSSRQYIQICFWSVEDCSQPSSSLKKMNVKLVCISNKSQIRQFSLCDSSSQGKLCPLPPHSWPLLKFLKVELIGGQMDIHNIASGVHNGNCNKTHSSKSSRQWNPVAGSASSALLRNNRTLFETLTELTNRKSLLTSSF